MLRGYRLFILVAFGWLALTGQSSSPRAEREQAKTQQSITDSLAHIAATNHDLAERANRPPKPEPCGTGNYLSDDDLCAQWKAADATADAAEWARLGTLLSGISSGLVLIALGLAYQANTIARETSRHQLRAYITLESTVAHPPETHSDGMRFQLVWENSGQTPASQIFCECGIGIFETHAIKQTDFSKMPRPIKSGPYITGPSHKFFGPDILAEHNDVLRAMNGKGIFVIWCEVEYRDIYQSKIRTTQACMQILLDADFGISMQPFGPFNSVA